MKAPDGAGVRELTPAQKEIIDKIDLAPMYSGVSPQRQSTEVSQSGYYPPANVEYAGGK